MKNVGCEESLGRKCRIGSHIFLGVNGEVMGRWSTNGGKMAPSSGEYGVGIGTFIRSGIIGGAIVSRGNDVGMWEKWS